MATFSIILQNEKRKFYKSFSIFILVLNALAICLFLYYFPQTTVQRSTGAICALLAVSVIVYREKVKSNRFTEAGIYLVMAALAIYWGFLGFPWAAMIIAVLAILYWSANKVPKVVVTEEQIIYPSFPEKRIEWKQLHNIVVKDGLLTIDFRDNRLIQQLLDPAARAPDEQEINEFCKAQLARSRRV